MNCQVVAQKGRGYMRITSSSPCLLMPKQMSPGTGEVDWNNPYELHIGKWLHQLVLDTIQSLKGSIVTFERYLEIAVYLLKKG